MLQIIIKLKCFFTKMIKSKNVIHLYLTLHILIRHQSGFKILNQNDDSYNNILKFTSLKKLYIFECYFFVFVFVSFILYCFGSNISL